MNRVDDLGEAQQVAVVGEIARPAAAFEIGDVRVAGHGEEADVVASHDPVSRRIAGVESPLRRRQGNGFLDEAAVESHPGLARRDGDTGVTEDVARLPEENVDPRFLEDAHGGVVDGLDIVGAGDIHRRIGIADIGPRQLRNLAGFSLFLPSAGGLAP